MIQDFPLRAEQKYRGAMSAIVKTARDMVRIAGPSALTCYVLYAKDFLSVVFSGHLGAAALGAVGIANMVMNVGGLSPGIGLLMALDTLCSNAFGGKQHMLLGLHCQRACVIVSLLCVPIAVLWWHTQSLLIAVGLHDVAGPAGEYVGLAVWGLWPSLIWSAYVVQTTRLLKPILSILTRTHCFAT
jgi:MATE family multidrug resistance protein